MESLKPIEGLEFLEDKHYYKVNGKFIPSVSSIIRPISKQIYGDIDEVVLSKAAERGTEVHLAVEIFDDTNAEVISDDLRGYFDAYKLFKTNNPQLQVIATEYRVYDPVLWFAGTVDKIYLDKTTNKMVLVDLKTSFNIEYSVVIPQLTGYAHALKSHGIDVANIYVLHLKADGTYKYEAILPNLDIFIACLSIQRYIKKYKKNY